MPRILFWLPVAWVVLLAVSAGPFPVSAEEEKFSRENRDKKYEFFGRDGQLYDSTEEFSVQTIPADYGRMVAVLVSPSNPKQREIWFEANDGVVRRVILVPIKNRKPPFLVYREILRFERD